MVIQPKNVGSKLVVKYTIYRIVHLLVLVQFAIQITKHGMNIMKGTMCTHIV